MSMMTSCESAYIKIVCSSLMQWSGLINIPLVREFDWGLTTFLGRIKWSSMLICKISLQGNLGLVYALPYRLLQSGIL